MLRRVPFHPLLIALYPAVALLANNLQEISIEVVVRPLFVSLGAALLLFTVLRLLLRNWERTALLTSFLLVLFFSYGHIYQLLKPFAFGRHRFLAPLFGLILLSGAALILRRPKNPAPLTAALNIAAVALLLLPGVQIGSYLANSAGAARAAQISLLPAQPLQPADPSALPDVYVIVMDTYTRSDALLRDFGYDNSAFVEGLQSLGFTVAECSRPNYNFTMGSLAAVLNFDYLSTIQRDLASSGTDVGIWTVLKQSRVRQSLEAIGYKTVAFDSGYEWSRLKDADVYLSLGGDSYALQSVTPFETMLIKSTALLLLTDSQVKAINSRFGAVNFPHNDHINLQRYILDQLPQLAADPQPKFVFAHILIPHVPYVFAPDGSIRTDSGFYGGERIEPVNDQYRIEGYTGEVAFINSQMLPILRQIIADSRVPPVIILMGDHGLRDQNRFQIFNAYYLPAAADALYPAITPVNSFRVVFDRYFGTHYGLLPDITYADDKETETVPETAPECK